MPRGSGSAAALWHLLFKQDDPDREQQDECELPDLATRRLDVSIKRS